MQPLCDAKAARLLKNGLCAWAQRDGARIEQRGRQQQMRRVCSKPPVDGSAKALCQHYLRRPRLPREHIRRPAEHAVDPLQHLLRHGSHDTAYVGRVLHLPLPLLEGWQRRSAHPHRRREGRCGPQRSGASWRVAEHAPAGQAPHWPGVRAGGGVRWTAKGALVHRVHSHRSCIRRVGGTGSGRRAGGRTRCALGFCTGSGAGVL
mmetsp:Transcript_30414/g.98248  ORF Transcript_30414/g.98248 Transcript_30414/m.98248 type:complete len:205 (+) Transcript_30414:538-1152(+)